MKRFFIIASSLILAVLISACGGGGGGGSSSGGGGSNESPDLSAGGVWEGVQSLTGEPDLFITGVVTENGDFHFVREDGAQFVGQVSVSGDRATGTYRALLAEGDVFVDGTNSGDGELDLTVSERDELRGNFRFETDGGLIDEGSLTLSYDSVYGEPSSTAIVSGIYTDSDDPQRDSLVIDEFGGITYQDGPTGCSGNGQIEPVDERFNAYELTFTFSNCSGEDAVINGETFDGLATLDVTADPEELIFGLAGVVQGIEFFIITFYQRTP